MKTYHHILFWVVTVVALTIFFGRSYGSMVESFFFVSMLLPVVTGTCYFFNYFLIPKYLFTKRKWRFALYTVYMLIVSMYFEMLVITVSFIYLANYKYASMGRLSGDVIVLAVTLYLIVLLFSFILLVRRSFSNEQNIQWLTQEKEKRKIGFLSVRADRKNTKIIFDDINYIESLSDYVKINSSVNGEIITKEQISKLTERLPDNFVRVHRSFVVNINKVTSFNKEHIILGDTSIPISRTYKKEALSALNK